MGHEKMKSHKKITIVENRIMLVYKESRITGKKSEVVISFVCMYCT